MNARRILLLGAAACTLALGISCQSTEPSINQPPDTSTSTVDYFPLSVGNRWYYSRRNRAGIEHEVVREYRDGDKVIFVLTVRTAGGTSADSQYLRKVSNGDVLRLATSEEDTLWRTMVAVGTSWNWAGTVTGTLINRDTTFRVPAGTFDSALSILVQDPYSTVPYLTGLAPGVGVIARRTIGDEIVLDSALIQGRRIP